MKTQNIGGEKMCARPRQPIELIQAKGKKHLTKAEIEARKNSELKVDLKDVKAPEYLSKELKIEFDDIANKLLHVGIMTELDEDLLAMYLLSKQSYIQYTKLLAKANKKLDIVEMEKLLSMQDKAFKQTMASANGLGLTISSRCKLVMPKVEEKPKENKFNKFGVVNG